MNQKDFNHQLVKLISQPTCLPPEDFILAIKEGAKLSADSALAVYREDYQVRLTYALKDTYKAIHFFLGEEDFYALAADYIKDNLSNSPHLDDYGKHLSDFLKIHHIKAMGPFLSELAHFEWAFKEVFHLDQAIGYESTTLMGLLDSGLKDPVHLVQSAKLLAYNYSITSLYQVYETDGDEDADFDFQNRDYLLLYKNKSVVKNQTLSKNQWEILLNLLTPISLSDLIKKAPTETTPEEIQSLFYLLGANRLLQKSS